MSKYLKKCLKVTEEELIASKERAYSKEYKEKQRIQQLYITKLGEFSSTFDLDKFASPEEATKKAMKLLRGMKEIYETV